ncbi:MAG: DUF2318 domain-containing protein, partial [Synergistaceae bacterium]|nr:DUF2318 domain-containing protein [Synergistaceae bacterium]
MGIIFSFSMMSSRKKLTVIFTVLGIISGFIVFAVRLYDPRGMNLLLMWFNRWLTVWVSALSIVSLVFVLTASVVRKNILHVITVFSLSVLIAVSLTFLVPPVLQFTREFIYFGEAGISTNAMMRALGFTLGIALCLLLILSAYEVHKALNTDSQKYIFMFMSLAVFAVEYSAGAVTALQRLKVIPLTDLIFKIMIWRGEN